MSTTPTSAEREAFESWAKTNRMRYPAEAFDFTDGVGDDYPHSRWLQMDWELWQARAALAATAAPAEPMIDGYPLYSGIPQPEQTADLHNAIMNLPATRQNEYPECRIAYKEGHCDARHAAAELVAQQSNAPALSDEQIREIYKKCVFSHRPLELPLEFARAVLAAQGGKP